MLEVVAGLIRDGERFLICQRPAHKARGLLWEFAGGKVEMGETGPQALKRELRSRATMATAATTVAPRNSQNCHWMSERFKKPKAAPRLWTSTRSSRPGMTVTGCRGSMAATAHHLVSWSRTSASRP